MDSETESYDTNENLSHRWKWDWKESRDFLMFLTFWIDWIQINFVISLHFFPTPSAHSLAFYEFPNDLGSKKCSTPHRKFLSLYSFSALSLITPGMIIWHLVFKLYPEYFSFFTCISLYLYLFFKLIHFLLNDNCFTEFYCFLSNLNMNQLPRIYLLFIPTDSFSFYLHHV